MLYLLCLCQLNEMHCSALWKSHFTCFCGQLDINLSRSTLTNWTATTMSDRFVSLLHFSVELFISMVYAAEANHCVSASVKRKVPYSLLESEFFRCLQAQWRLLGMDWGTRQLVFTTVIDRWAPESGLQSYWCLSPALACCLMSNQTASCLILLLFLCAPLCVCVHVYGLTVHTCQTEYIYTPAHAYMCASMVEHPVCMEANICTL